MMNFNQNLEKLREKISEIGSDAIIISMNNFFGNYDSEFSGIGYISGFTGSNGRAIVSQNKALLSVDGRYVKQATEQTDPKFWEIKMYPDFDTNALASEILKPRQSLAIGMFSITYKSYLSILSLSNALDFKLNLIDELPIPAPKKSEKEIYLIGENDTGETRKSRIERIKNTLENDEALLIADTALIGWAFGVRIQPTEDKCVLPNCVAFIQKSGKPMVFSDLNLKESSEDFEFFNVTEFEKVISNIKKTTVNLDYMRTSLYFPEILQRNGFSIKAPKKNYGTFESIKNETEIKNMKSASRKASLAFIKTLAFVEGAEQTSEIEVAEFFENELKKYDDFVSLSFNSISSFKRNTSFVHYNPKSQGGSSVSSNGLFLFDAGGHFKGATTDMTRTIYRGDDPSNEIKVMYSAVLRSIIIFSSMKFPDKSKACYLDSIARFFIWHKGYDYHFGTGHGIGSYANVHEHPRIAPTSFEEITKNMVITIEPGIYQDNFGIRMENMLLTKPSNKEGFVEFETMNFIPFSRKLVIKEMFSNFELEWLNKYHQTIFEKFADELESDRQAFNWLYENTREI